ncbi:MAG: hypothetical protein ACREOZ_04245, partial [Gloeomargaritales cyanobacterium]
MRRTKSMQPSLLLTTTVRQRAKTGKNLTHTMTTTSLKFQNQAVVLIGRKWMSQKEKLQSWDTGSARSSRLMPDVQAGLGYVLPKRNIFVAKRPRTKAVLHSIGVNSIIKEGGIFDTRLEVQLRISEVANLLGKELRYSRHDSDALGERGFITSEKLVARCKNASDSFLVRAGLVKAGWKIYRIRLSHLTPTKATIYTAKQLVPLTLCHLS